MTPNKKSEIDTPHELALSRELTDEEIAIYETWKGSHFGELDEYFEMMMKGAGVDNEDEKQVYELAVRAFINDIAHNGLPAISSARYKCELEGYLSIYGLRKKATDMIKKRCEDST